MLFVLFPGFGDGKEKWGRPFLPMLKKLGNVFFPPDIHESKEVSIKRYVRDLQIPKSKKTILIGHSIGLWFAYEYAKIHPVTAIISLDGSYIGKYVLNSANRVLSKKDAEPLLVDLVKQAPMKASKFPVKTICFRNIVFREDLKPKEVDNNAQAILESENIKNYKVHFYVNKTHYLHEDLTVCREIIEEIKKL